MKLFNTSVDRTNTIPLHVAKWLESDAQNAGALWDEDSKAWYCDRALLTSTEYPSLKPFVPRMYRHNANFPVLRPFIVPQTLWGHNLRSTLESDAWHIIRQHICAKYGYRCMVCGRAGSKSPVKADDIWEYDDENHSTTLKSIIPLCPNCHAIRHWGENSLVGKKTEDILAHIMFVNRLSRYDAERIVIEAITTWEQRSNYNDWSIDYSWVVDTYQVSLNESAIANINRTNKEISAHTRARAMYLD